MLLYAVLHLIGWFKKKDLKQFRQLESHTPGHPEVKLPGVEATTGPLGQGIGMPVGLAFSEALLNENLVSISKNATDIVDNFPYV